MPPGPSNDPVERMTQGFGRFYEQDFKIPGGPYETLRKGQNPHTMVVACADSRVGPNMLLQTAPGEIFVVRNVANLVPPSNAADSSVGSALEYAVGHIEVPNVIVFGHAGCGGIGALLDGADAGDNAVGRWLSHATPVRDAIRECKLAPEAERCACERASIIHSLANLLSYPCVRENVAAGKLTLRGWYFDLMSGELWECLPPAEEFVRRVPVVG
jgi:carbonic anhydrase